MIAMFEVRSKPDTVEPDSGRECGHDYTGRQRKKCPLLTKWPLILQPLRCQRT